MPQALYHASGLTADNADKLKDAGMNVPGVKWVNINNGNIVVTPKTALMPMPLPPPCAVRTAVSV